MTLIYFLIIIYLVPIVSLFLRPFRGERQFNSLAFHAGRVEWILAFLRDGLLAPALLVFSIYSIFVQGFVYHYPVVLIFPLLSLRAHLARKEEVIKIVEMIPKSDLVAPDAFFREYFIAISTFPARLPERMEATGSLSLNFQKKTGLSILPIIKGLFYTAALARIVLLSSKLKGENVCPKVAEYISSLWGILSLQLSSASLELCGTEHLENLRGRTIFACDHKSLFDFTIFPIAIWTVNAGREVPFKTRYMAAKDHFLDNIFLHRIIGMGRAMQRAGTIFVDRSSKNRDAKAAIDEAAKAVIESGADIVIFPQGTRAYGCKNGRGERSDAGYYTTIKGRDISKARPHLKKGAAYLALDAEWILSKDGQSLNIVPVCIRGTGTVAPRGSFRVQKGVALKVEFGNAIVITPDDIYELPDSSPRAREIEKKMIAEKIYERIDEALKEVVGIDGLLKKKAAATISKIMKDEDVDRFFKELDMRKKEHSLIFSIIDCIYARQPREWPGLMRRLSDLLVRDMASVTELLEYKKLVAKGML